MSILAEQNIIGSLLSDQNCINEISEILEPEMFSNPLLGKVYAEYLKGYENGYEVNVAVIEQKLVNDKCPASYLEMELEDCLKITVTRATIKSQVDVVVKDYKANQLEQLLNRVRAEPSVIYEQIGELIQDLESLVGDRKTKAISVSEMVDLYKDHYFCDEAEKGLVTGFHSLDEKIGSLQGGDVIVIGARPAVGKSAFVTQLSTSLAKQGKRIGFYNLEMRDRQMYERFVVAESGIELTRLKRAVNFLHDEQERFDNANKLIKSKYGNLIINTGAHTMSDIRSESRHMEYDIIIIDYMQLITPETTYRGNRAAEVGEISRKIKNLAMELDIPIIALSQLNRVSERTETKEPTMSELRESGNVEQDASIILLMWNLTEDRTQKGLKIEKNRQGEVGKITLYFDGKHMKFSEEEGVMEVSEEPDDDIPFT